MPYFRKRMVWEILHRKLLWFHIKLRTLQRLNRPLPFSAISDTDGVGFPLVLNRLCRKRKKSVDFFKKINFMDPRAVEPFQKHTCLFSCVIFETLFFPMLMNISFNLHGVLSFYLWALFKTADPCRLFQTCQAVGRHGTKALGRLWCLCHDLKLASQHLVRTAQYMTAAAAHTSNFSPAA